MNAVRVWISEVGIKGIWIKVRVHWTKYVFFRKCL